MARQTCTHIQMYSHRKANCLCPLSCALKTHILHWAGTKLRILRILRMCDRVCVMQRFQYNLQISYLPCGYHANVRESIRYIWFRCESVYGICYDIDAKMQPVNLPLNKVELILQRHDRIGNLSSRQLQCAQHIIMLERYCVEVSGRCFKRSHKVLKIQDNQQTDNGLSNFVLTQSVKSSEIVYLRLSQQLVPLRILKEVSLMCGYS